MSLGIGIRLNSPQSLAGGSTWTPANFGADQFASFYPERNITLVGNSLDIWGDDSGNGRDMSASSSGVRPTYTTNLINGYDGPVFDGTNDRIRHVLASDVTDPMTFGIVLKWMSTPLTGKLVIDGNVTATKRMRFQTINSPTPVNYRFGSDTGTQLASPNELTDSTGPHYCVILFNQGSSYLRTNGTLDVSGSISAATLSGFSISGAYNGGAGSFANIGVIAFFMVKKVLTTEELAKFEAYLSSLAGV